MCIEQELSLASVLRNNLPLSLESFKRGKSEREIKKEKYLNDNLSMEWSCARLWCVLFLYCHRKHHLRTLPSIAIHHHPLERSPKKKIEQLPNTSQTNRSIILFSLIHPIYLVLFLLQKLNQIKCKTYYSTDKNVLHSSQTKFNIYSWTSTTFVLLSKHSTESLQSKKKFWNCRLANKFVCYPSNFY